MGILETGWQSLYDCQVRAQARFVCLHIPHSHMGQNGAFPVDRHSPFVVNDGC